MKTKIVLLAGIGLALGACRHHDMMAMEPTHRLNPVKVAESVERLELYSRPNGLELSARDEQAVVAFMQDYAQRGAGPIYVNRPSATKDGLGVVQTNEVLSRLMVRAGLNPASAQSGTYQSSPGDPAPVVVSYRTLRTVIQDCSDLRDLSATSNNSVHPGFGCFASANLAAMISDPQQLIQPYPSDVPNAQRRQVVYDRYIQGQPTGAARPADQAIDSQTSGGTG